MDGVLTDFVGSACVWFNKYDPYQHDPKNSYGKWDLGRLLDIRRDVFDTIWDDYRFWAGMHWAYDGKEILASVLRNFNEQNVYLTTSPGPLPGAFAGKVMWIRENMGAEWVERTIMIKHKWLLARHINCILIDDKPANVIGFRDEGGQALLIRRPWNTDYETSEMTPQILENIPKVVDEYLAKEASGL